MPQKLWIPGEEVVADDLNDYLQNQVVAVFTNAATRTTDWPLPPVGAYSFLTDTKTLSWWTGAQWSPAAGQTVAYAEVTANQTGITTLADLTSLSVTFAPDGYTTYKVAVQGQVTSTVVADLIVGYIRSGSTQLQRWAQHYQVGSGGTSLLAHGSCYITPLGGSYTVKASLERNAGTGSVSLLAAAGYPAFISVEAV
jgi:hypothetical protein